MTIMPQHVENKHIMFKNRGSLTAKYISVNTCLRIAAASILFSSRTRLKGHFHLDRLRGRENTG
jgi:hypothetical protein